MPRLDEPFEHEYTDSLIEHWIYAHDIVPHGTFKVKWDWTYPLYEPRPEHHFIPPARIYEFGMTPPKWVQRDMHTPEQIEPPISCLESIRQTLELPEACSLDKISDSVRQLAAEQQQ